MWVEMKKLFFVLFGLCITTAGFADVLKVSESESEKGIVNQFDFNKFIRAMGFCSDEEPLLLTNGKCVPCDYKPGKSESFDILFGCEKCPKLKKKESDCIVKMDLEDTKSKKSDKSKKNKSGENSSADKYKYDLVNVMGVGDNLQMTLIENATGQKKNVVIGDVLDGYTIESISLKEIVFEKDGIVQTLKFDIYD